LVATTLTHGLPVSTAAAPASCITRLADWYSDAGGPAIVRDLVLFDNGKGGYVNRFGPMGEQWATQPIYTGRWCGNGDSKCTATEAFHGCDFDPTVDTCFYPCPQALGAPADSCAGTVSSTTKYDGTPLFFPLDDQPKTEVWIDAKVPLQYGYDWPYEDTVSPTYGAAHVAGKAAHNFHFTTQLTSWFKCDDASPAPLDFAGDDDLWVFVNGRLAVDLGGVHSAGETSLTLDAAAATDLGLQSGGVYPIDVFHAERKKDSASLRVTLPGFDSSRSECRRL
jgi:fibro-slime domain-containing protein